MTITKPALGGGGGGGTTHVAALPGLRTTSPSAQQLQNYIKYLKVYLNTLFLTSTERTKK